MAAARIGVAMNFPRIALCSLLILVAAAPLMAQGTYTQIDVPGSLNTLAFGINTGGDVVGLYADSTGFAHGFLLSGGTYTTIDYPTSGLETELYGVNDVGQIVGFTFGGQVGFEYDVASGTFTTISFPGSLATYPTSINNAGTIAGYYLFGTGLASGFEYRGGTYKSIRPRRVSSSYVAGISANGTMVGNFTTMQLTEAIFLFKHGKYEPITIPTTGVNATALGINDAATALVGVYQPTVGTSAGFIYQNKVVQEVQFPLATSTYAYGVNDSDEVTGFFCDSSLHNHGFTWTPSAASPKP